MSDWAVDFHTHPLLVREMIARHPDLAEAARKTFYIGNNFQPLETFHLELDAAGLDKAVVVAVDATTALGKTVYNNEQVAELCSLSDRLIGFASVDPNQKDAPAKLEAAITQLKLRGLKLDPAMQRFRPSDAAAYPVYEKAQALGIPVLFHAGMSWAPGSRLEYGQPLLFEPIAVDFPKLNIVLAHLAWPWVTEAVALCLKYPNVHLDTSALYFDNPRDFLRHAMTQVIPKSVFENSLRRQILFGSNYPRVEIKNMANALRWVGFSDDFQKLIFGGNAARLLGGIA